MGRFNWDWDGEGPPDEAYLRVTEPERFWPLHEWTLEVVDRLLREYDVTLEESKLTDYEIELSTLVRPIMKLTPGQDSCAPITIVFTDFPGITVRVGRWVTDHFPSCGCDACDEMPDEEFEGFTELLDDVVAGRFRESMRLQPGGDGWSSREFWSAEGHSSGESRVPRAKAERILNGKSEIVLEWQPWQSTPDGTTTR
ncbi:MAG: DUF6226 family protein [Chloroflexota bacterium]|nr:DUF6226 family protein [Chloroflexota bacterium]